METEVTLVARCGMEVVTLVACCGMEMVVTALRGMRRQLRNGKSKTIQRLHRESCTRGTIFFLKNKIKNKNKKQYTGFKKLISFPIDFF